MSQPFLKIRHGLVDHKHLKRMGNSVWLYMWLMLRVDWDSGRVRWNMGEVSEDYDISYETVRKWRRALERWKYISTDVRRGATGYLESVIQKWLDPRGEKMRGETVTDTVIHTVTDTVTPILVLPTDSDIPDESDKPLTTTAIAPETVTPVTHSKNKDYGRLAAFWEQNFGALVPHNKELLEHANATYGAEITLYALQQAIRANVRRWDYAEAIMKRVQVEGYSEKKNGTHQKPSGTSAHAARGAGLHGARSRRNAARTEYHLDDELPAGND